MSVNLTKFSANVNNIQGLSDRPNTVDGLTSSELKALFDKAGSDIKTYLNGVLTVEVQNALNSINNSIISNINTKLQEQKDSLFPIGKIEIFYDDNDHSNYLGFTWVRELDGRVPVGLDTTQSDFSYIGETGGSKYLQRHNHTGKTGKGYTDFARVIGGVGTSSTANHVVGYSSTSYTDLTNTSNFNGANHWHEFTTNNSGTGTSGNLQPYKVVAFWKRVS